jgi:O-antigen ligase
LAIFVESLVGTFIYFFGINRDLTLVESLTEHSAAIHINAVLVLCFSAWLYKGGSPTKRLLIPIMLPTILLTYVAAQRRAAFLTIIIALVLMVVILFLERRIIFWVLVPPAAVLGLVYLAVFWNSSGALGLPAQAIKSIVAQDQANAKDQSSNLYRQLENVNAHYTISQAPLTGVGFGQKLQIIVPLPDISFFVWWEYITHNSIIWIWVKTGIGGFVSMLVLIGLSIMVGMRALQRMPTGDLKTVALTSTLFLIMHFIYAYVDISWDNQSMLLVGAMMGISSCLERVVALDRNIQRKRYPWQADPQPEPGLRPLRAEITS